MKEPLVAEATRTRDRRSSSAHWHHPLNDPVALSIVFGPLMHSAVKAELFLTGRQFGKEKRHDRSRAFRKVFLRDSVTPW